MNNKISPNDIGLQNHTTSVGALPHIVVGFMLWLVGALAVIFIIIGGIQYVVSAGDPKKTAQAKNTILYAIIGVVLAVAAGAIVKFVLHGLI